MKKWWEMTRKFQENEHNTILNKTKIPRYSLNLKIQGKPSNKNKNRWQIPDSIFFSFSGQRREKTQRKAKEEDVCVTLTGGIRLYIVVHLDRVYRFVGN